MRYGLFKILFGALMAFASVGSFLGAGHNTAGTSWAPTTSATLEAGNCGVIVLALDNTGTTDADHSEVTSVIDAAGNTWVKGREYTNGQGAAAAGATVSVWYAKITSQLTSGSTVTFNLANSVTAKAAAGWEFTMGSGSLLLDTGGTEEAVDNGGMGALSVTGGQSGEHIWVRGAAWESGSAVLSAITSGWTEITGAAGGGGGAASRMSAGGEFKIATGTGSGTSDPEHATSDNVSVLFGIYEIAGAAGTLTRNMMMLGMG